MTMQSIVPGVYGLPLSERLLLRTHELAQAGRMTTRLVDRLSFTSSTPGSGIKIHLTGVTLDRLQVFGVQHNISAAVRSAPLQCHHIVIPLRGRMQAGSDAGWRDVLPGTGVIYPAGTLLEAWWPSESVALIVTVSRREFDRACANYERAAFPGTATPTTVALTSGAGRSFANVLGCLCTECNSREGSPTVVRGLEELALNAMLELTRPAALPGHRVTSTTRRQRGLQRALHHLDAYPRQHPDIVELAKVACLSRRSLETAFTEHFGVGPRAYVTGERLDRARAELLTASTALISSIAEHWGFDDPSRFARLYRRRFGESPTATRLRAQRGR